jgi:hypothetical protein
VARNILKKRKKEKEKKREKNPRDCGLVFGVSHFDLHRRGGFSNDL